MKPHRVIIEAGPETIRRLCCGTSAFGEPSEAVRGALSAIDDHVALVGERPLAVAELWSGALRAAACAYGDRAIVVHPSWWSPSRVDVVTAAAADAFDDVVVRPRSWLLGQASTAGPTATVLVEITERLVAITGPEVLAVPRGPDPQPAADAVGAVIARTAAAVAVIDVPGTVAGAPALADAIAAAARGYRRPAVQVDDGRLARLAQSASRDSRQSPAAARAARRDRRHSRARTLTGLAVAAVALGATAPAMVTADRRDAVNPAPRMESARTAFLVEGRVAVTVPAEWPVQRVVAGPGSARVQLTSPSDPEVALHVTQSPVVAETLSITAERMKRAIDEQAVGTFVDFNPAGTSAGRPAVTYREVRTGHDVRWTVLLDGPVRISLGCQSRPGAEDAVRDVCERAVRSAHAIR